MTGAGLDSFWIRTSHRSSNVRKARQSMQSKLLAILSSAYRAVNWTRSARNVSLLSDDRWTATILFIRRIDSAQEFSRCRRHVGSAEDIRNHRETERAGSPHVTRALGRYASDCKHRNTHSAARALKNLKSQRRAVLAFRRRLLNRAKHREVRALRFRQHDAVYR